MKTATPSPVDLMREAILAIGRGDYAHAQVVTEAALQTPQMRRAARKAPQTVDQLMPLIKRKEAAGPVLRKIRKAYGMGQEQMAQLCGCTHQFIALVEGGRSPLPKPMVEKLFAWVAERDAERMGSIPPTAALLKLQKTLGLDVGEFADALGINYGFIRKIVEGKSQLNTVVAGAARRLAAKHNLDLDKLAA